MNDYYVKQQAVLVKNHDKLMALGVKLMHSHYGEEKTARWVARARQEFEKLIPQIPYIGGTTNSFTDLLIQITSLLALYRAMRPDHVPVDEIGKLTHQIAQAWIDQHPKFVRSMIGRFYMSRFWRRRTRKRAQASQQRRYEGDFVYEVVEGDGKNFDWGINYLECAVVKFAHRQGAEEFAPYLCEIDYLMFPAMGINLVRTGTIATGCTYCDFRFKRR